jgi:hypothetical protein
MKKIERLVILALLLVIVAALYIIYSGIGAASARPRHHRPSPTAVATTAAAPVIDYAVAYSGGPATVSAPLEHFTRTAVVSNVGNTEATSMTLTFRGVLKQNKGYASVLSSDLDSCSLYYYSSGVLNYIRCTGNVAPGQSAAVTIQYTSSSAPAAWNGYTYYGSAQVSALYDSNTSNDYVANTVTTTISV